MYLTSFLVNGFVSVVEFAAWFLYMFGKNWWFGWWVNYPGWIGSVVLGTLPAVFALLQLVMHKDYGGLQNQTDVEFGYNSILYLIMGIIMWVQSASMHILMASRVACHIATIPEPSPPRTKKCPLKKLEEMNDEEY